jgi:RNA polymerase sigma-70 factor (ECF subfamily)
VVHDEAEAEDLLQEIFMQVWGRAENYSPEKGKPLGWLVTLARRRAIDRLRQRRAYRRATDRFELECKVPHFAQGRGRFDSSIFHDDLRELLCKLIDGLPAFQRQAIMLAFFEGMSQREISNATRIPLGTIKTRIELGMRKLACAVMAVRDKIE